MEANEAIRRLFDEAIGLPREAREAFVRAGSADEQVVGRVLELLACDDTSFLEEPAAVSYAQVLVDEPETLDEFRVIRRLGEGGMGVVYLAEDTRLKRLVALKVLTPQLASGAMAGRFRHEAQIAAGLDHPAIVPVHQFHESGETRYLVMKYIDGVPLSAHLARRAAQDDGPGANPARGSRTRLAADRRREVARLVQAVGEALEHAHSRGVVHRDVKPSNIIVDAAGQAYLTDFGIAKAGESTVLTSPGQTLGTPFYMSPEQAGIDLAAIDARTDVFSLGVVLYEALTGRRPFLGETPAQVLHAIRTTEPAPLRRVDPTIPRELETITRVAMEKERRQRYQTAAHMAADLRCWLRGDPILARPLSPARRGARWMRRHRLRAVSAAAAGLIVIALVLAGLIWRHQRSLTTPVVIRSGLADATVWCRETNPQTLELTARRRLGHAPVQRRLRPGQYRLTAIADDGRFEETSLTIVRPGAPIDLDLAPGPAAAPPGQGMVRFEGGPWTTGFGDRLGVQGRRTVTVAPFFIDEAEVSNAEYLGFITATGRARPRHWVEYGYDAALEDHPIVGISWDDAQAYARWVGKRLPTVFEWEFAMRHPDHRRTPWGEHEPADLFKADRKDTERAGISDPRFQYSAYARYTRPVREDPHAMGAIRHAATNVQEMTESVSVGSSTVRVIKGAGWHQSPEVANFAEIFTLPFESVLADGRREGDTSMKVGFRCAQSVQP